jgi:hypothetical protein
MSRYKDISLKKSREGARVTKPVIYPPIARSVEDIYVVTTPGDRLDLLAHKYYGNISYWWMIAEANGLGKGTVALEPGIQVRIPANPTTILANLRETNKQ